MIAMDGVAVIDMRTAVLSTQAAADAFKALEEDPDYSANLEEAKSIQADRQAMAEKLQKEVDTLSEVTLWLGGRMLEGELVDASAAATPYLKCLDKF